MVLLLEDRIALLGLEFQSDDVLGVAMQSAAGEVVGAALAPWRRLGQQSLRLSCALLLCW